MKKHAFKSGYTRPFRANCMKCGEKKQNQIHKMNDALGGSYN